MHVTTKVVANRSPDALAEIDPALTRRLIQEAVEHADAEDRPDFCGLLAPASPLSATSTASSSTLPPCTGTAGNEPPSPPAASAS
ncbi:hypothetical protein [Streptomyces sp. NPDC055006]